MKIQINNGRLLDPATGLDRTGTLCMKNGLILSLAEPAMDFKPDEIIEADGKWVCPGIIDLAARFGEPGKEYKATIATESPAAASAGITAVCCPPDTSPVIDTPAVVELIHRRAQMAGAVRIYPLAALTLGLQGERLSEMYALKQAGCVAVSNTGGPLPGNEVLRRTMEYAVSTDLPVFLHAEDQSLRNRGVVNEGVTSTRLGLPPVPETAETVAVSTALLLAEQTGARVHFCRLSAARSVEMIGAAKKAGLPVTADAGICHLYLTELDVDGYNSSCHLTPPLRTLADKQALLQGLIEGVIDAVCSDHRPCDEDSKIMPFAQTRPGASTIEMLLPLMLDLADKGLLSPLQVVAALSTSPAAILGLEASGLVAGKPADITVIDPQLPWSVDSALLLSAGKITPFAGWELPG